MSLNGKKEKIFNAINKSKIPEYTAQTNALSQVCMCYVYVCACVHSLETRFQVECQLICHINHTQCGGAREKTHLNVASAKAAHNSNARWARTKRSIVAEAQLVLLLLLLPMQVQLQLPIEVK